MKYTEVERVSTIRADVLIVAAAVCAFFSGLVWHTRGPAAWERPFMSLFRHEQLPMAHSLVLLWQPLPFVLATLFLARIALKSNRVQLAVSGTAGCLTAMVVTEHVLKPLVARHPLHTSASLFPSGHVTASAAWAMFAWFVIDRRSRGRGALVLVPIAVGWAVISTGAHYPADAIGGLVVGGLVVYAVVIAANRSMTALLRRSQSEGVKGYARMAADGDQAAVLA